MINRRSNSTMCSNCQQPWESVIVIPASSFCWNFGNFDELPIASWPKDKPTRDPFEYCRKKDHYRCVYSGGRGRGYSADSRNNLVMVVTSIGAFML